MVILILRYRISGRRQQIHLRKRELAPMITRFLFFQQETDSKEREEYIRMKIEIREQLKIPFNREVLTEVLMDLRKDVTGKTRTRLMGLYQDLGLHQDAFAKLKSTRWEKVSQGIIELTEMRVDQAYHIVKKRINDKKSVIRRQAQLAIVNLRPEGLRYVLDTARHRISEWQQLKLMELLNQKQDFDPPRFRDWLISENEDVVLFALRLIRHYRQSDASRAIITLLQHRSPEIQVAALECIREFRFSEARTALKQHFENATSEIKVLILDTLWEVVTEDDLIWLQNRAAKDRSFLVRSKAGMLINALKPETILPTKDILPLPELDDFGWEEALSGTFDALVSELETTQNDLETVLKEPALPGADFTDIRLDPEWMIREELQLPATEIDLGSLPEEDWTPEHEKIFAHCFLEELRDLLSIGSARVSLPDISLDFLPVIAEETTNTNTMEPHQPTPDWLRKLDVQAQILSADCGYARVLREILLEDLAETEQVLNTDFVPGITGTEQAGEKNSDEVPSALELDPDFGVIAGEIHEVQGPVETEAPPAQTGGGVPVEEGEVNYFSIFREFFRSYDRESKLILLDEIPEIGTEKELYFLEELFEDPDEKLADKARKVYALLARRLGVNPKALKNKGSQTLWTPPSASTKNTLRKKGQPVKDVSDLQSDPEHVFAFIPEFDTAPVPQKAVTHKARRRKNRLFRFLGGTQNDIDE